MDEKQREEVCPMDLYLLHSFAYHRTNQQVILLCILSIPIQNFTKMAVINIDKHFCEQKYVEYITCVINWLQTRQFPPFIRLIPMTTIISGKWRSQQSEPEHSANNRRHIIAVGGRRHLPLSFLSLIPIPTKVGEEVDDGATAVFLGAH
jgi:hypothetical protein